jgi:hypothetical protein
MELGQLLNREFGVGTTEEEVESDHYEAPELRRWNS